jgi:cobalt-zinc-cadmium efflux system outer membrane protein
MKKTFTLLLTLTSTLTFGLENCKIQSANELLDLIKIKHPTISRNNSNKLSINLATEKAKQRPNPELDSEIMTGDSEDGSVFNTSVSLKHVFELGGKRDSRIQVAKSYIKTQSELARFANENALIDSVLKIQRLSQVYELIPMYKEATATFEDISKRMNARSSLSPQEEVEKETLGLATNDYKLKLSQLYAERMYLKRHLTLFAGLDCEITKKNIKGKIILNADIDDVSTVDKYSKLNVAKSNLELAKSKLSSAKSVSYPNMALGPLYEYEKTPKRVNHSFGLSLTMDLPVFNTNDAGKSIASNDIATASISYNNIKKESELDLASWKNKYSRYNQSLKSVAKKEELERKHMKIEKLFARGIISTSLVIESHRQLLEFTNSRLEFEAGALEALWYIYELTGSINNKKL